MEVARLNLHFGMLFDSFKVLDLLTHFVHQRFTLEVEVCGLVFRFKLCSSDALPNSLLVEIFHDLLGAHKFANYIISLLELACFRMRTLARGQY